MARIVRKLAPDRDRAGRRALHDVRQPTDDVRAGGGMFARCFEGSAALGHAVAVDRLRRQLA